MGFLTTPLAWLALAGWLAVPLTYGTMWVKREVAVHGAYEAGKKDGAAAVAAAGVESAERTARARVEAEAEVPATPADKADLIKLCKRSASCRERGSLR